MCHIAPFKSHCTLQLTLLSAGPGPLFLQETLRWGNNSVSVSVQLCFISANTLKKVVHKCVSCIHTCSLIQLECIIKTSDFPRDFSNRKWLLFTCETWSFSVIINVIFLGGLKWNKTQHLNLFLKTTIRKKKTKQLQTWKEPLGLLHPILKI